MVSIIDIAHTSTFDNTGGTITVTGSGSLAGQGIVVAMCYTSDWGSIHTNDITINSLNGSIPWTLGQKYTNNSDSALFIWYHVMDVSESFSGYSVTLNWPQNTGGLKWGATILLIDGANTINGNLVGWGNSAIGANQIAAGLLPSFNFKTIGDQSMVIFPIVDWDANTHTNPIFSTVNNITPGFGVNQILYTDSSFNYSILVFYWDNVGVSQTNNYALLSTVVAAIESTQGIFEITNYAEEIAPDIPPISGSPTARPPLELNGLAVSARLTSATSTTAARINDY